MPKALYLAHSTARYRIAFLCGLLFFCPLTRGTCIPTPSITHYTGCSRPPTCGWEPPPCTRHLSGNRYTTGLLLIWKSAVSPNTATPGGLQNVLLLWMTSQGLRLYKPSPANKCCQLARGAVAFTSTSKFSIRLITNLPTYNKRSDNEEMLYRYGRRHILRNLTERCHTSVATGAHSAATYTVCYTTIAASAWLHFALRTLSTNTTRRLRTRYALCFATYQTNGASTAISRLQTVS